MTADSIVSWRIVGRSDFGRRIENLGSIDPTMIEALRQERDPSII
ncbi:hypothetical protein QTI17_15380 [Variovorax sp. J31P179]|nr:hypothetical protein [Variovorax sp. J31P179]MDM0081977.1 hypothetical protein [Variovorax sp. J31P179]